MHPMDSFDGSTKTQSLSGDLREQPKHLHWNSLDKGTSDPGLTDTEFGQNFFSFGDGDEGPDAFLDMSNEIARDAGGSWLNIINNDKEQRYPYDSSKQVN